MRGSWYLGAAVGLALLGCGGGGGSGDSKGPEWKTVENSEGGYSLKVPWWSDAIGWYPNKIDGGSTTVSNGDADIDCAAEINKLGEAASLEDFVKADLAERKKNKGFTVISEPTSVQVDGKPGQRVTYKMKSHLWAHDGDGTHTETITYVLKGKNVVSLRTSARTDKWEKRIKYFKEMHKSFSLK